MVFAHDLGVVCEINTFHSGTETWRNLPDVYSHSSEDVKMQLAPRLYRGMDFTSHTHILLTVFLPEICLSEVHNEIHHIWRLLKPCLVKYFKW